MSPRRHYALLLIVAMLVGSIAGAPLVRQAVATITFSIPNTFGSQSGAIPVSQIDDNFTAIKNALSGLVAASADLPITRAYTGTQRWAKGADLTCAAALTLGSDGNYFVVNGACGITTISTLEAGTQILLRFGGASTITHSANIILLGATNATTAAGDLYWFVSDGGGIWREVWRRPVTGASTTTFFSGLGTWSTPSGGVSTLTDVSGTRSLGTAVQNTGSGTLWVMFEGITDTNALDFEFQVKVENANPPTVVIFDVYTSSPVDKKTAHVTFPVPAGWYYLITNITRTNVNKWTEGN